MGNVNNALKALVYKLFLEIFYEKIIKQLIFLTTFSISHKSDFKNFLDMVINNCPK